MARTIAQIKQIMIDEKNSQSALSGLTSTSQTAIWNLWFFIVASCIAIFEQLQDLFKQDLEIIAYNTPPNTPQWTRKKVLEFQYDATTPQIPILDTNTFVVTYPVINTALNIITRCAVITNYNKTVLIKVAKNDPPEPLDSYEAGALGDWLEAWVPAGITGELINIAPDLVEVAANVYYDGQYSLVIQSLVETALQNYFKNLPFNGQIKTQLIVDAIQGVTGVVNVSLTEINCRSSFETYGNGVTLFSLPNGVDNVFYNTYAGYVVNESAPHDFNATINYYVMQ